MGMWSNLFKREEAVSIKELRYTEEKKEALAWEG